MADRLNIEIGGRLVPILLRFAQEQGRDPDEVMEEALLLYLRERDVDLGRSIGKPAEERPREPLLALLDRMSSRFDLDEDEAMRIAVEEQRAFRSERADRERERTER